MKVSLLVAVLALPALPVTVSAVEVSTVGAGGKTSPSDRAFTDSMKTMMKGMDVRTTGDPDKDFVAMMIPHHRGAIDMARVELKYGKDPILRRLARDIVAAQEKEVGDMRAWQAERSR